MLIFERDTWSEIYHTLDKNKARTLLTMVGVAWGMLLFVFLLGVVNGLSNGFDKELKGTSTNSLFIWTQQTSVPYDGFGRGRTFRFQLSDIDALKKEFKEIKIITPRQRNDASVVHQAKNGNYSIFGDFPEQNKIFVKKILKGRYITQKDIENNAKVAVISDRLIDELYDKGSNPLGTTIQIFGVNFKVVGVYSGDSKGGIDSGSTVTIPFATFNQIFNQGNNVGLIVINIDDYADIKKAETQIKDFLKTRHHIAPNDTQALGSFNLGEMFGKVFRFMQGLEFLTVVVDFFTLLAGVLAVSSILLITVKERTQEFGIRRALGAPPSQIVSQILLESSVITFFSGLLGIIAGTALLAGINTYVANAEKDDFPFINSSINLSILLGAFILVLVMSLLAGLIPALRAVAIKPIDALREE
ncbi:ABC transporter permease [Ornithobacterium rhinotracheale]|uniref:ABC transporter permease n=1 Tax=Ornithobacterium rhinotracheale TaxID=28251 RepID=UPI003FA41880